MRRPVPLGARGVGPGRGRARRAAGRRAAPGLLRGRAGGAARALVPVQPRPHRGGRLRLAAERRDALADGRGRGEPGPAAVPRGGREHLRRLRPLRRRRPADLLQPALPRALPPARRHAHAGARLRRARAGGRAAGPVHGRPRRRGCLRGRAPREPQERRAGRVPAERRALGALGRPAHARRGHRRRQDGHHRAASRRGAAAPERRAGGDDQGPGRPPRRALDAHSAHRPRRDRAAPGRLPRQLQGRPNRRGAARVGGRAAGRAGDPRHHRRAPGRYPGRQRPAPGRQGRAALGRPHRAHRHPSRRRPDDRRPRRGPQRERPQSGPRGGGQVRPTGAGGGLGGASPRGGAAEPTPPARSRSAPGPPGPREPARAGSRRGGRSRRR